MTSPHHSMTSLGSTDKPEAEHLEKDPNALPEDLGTDLDEGTLKQLLVKYPVKEWNRHNIKLYVLCVCAYLNSTTNGYDGSMLTSISTLPTFLDYFNLKGSPGSTGLVFAIYPIASICATFFIPMSDMIGRVRTIAIGLIILIVGAIVSACVDTLNLFIFARFLLSFGAAIALSATPILLLEVLPANRKFLGMFFNTFYYIGSLICSWTAYGTSIHYDDTRQFKIPLWLQILCPGISLCCVFFFPESPRYLYSKGRVQECQDFIVRYHAGGDPTHPIVLAEINQIAASFAQSGHVTFASYFDFTAFLSSRSNRRRGALIVVWAWFCQFSGNQVITYYMTTLFLNLGITNATTRLLLTAVNSIVCFLFATAGAFFVEHVGAKRPALLVANAGFVISFVSLTIATKEFNDDPNNKMAAQVGIAFIYIFQAVFFSFIFTPLQPTYPSELGTNALRGKAMAIYNLVSNAASTLNLYTAPLAMQNIKHFFYMFFALWDLFQFVVIYFFFVETSYLSLEEIEHVFNSENPVKESVRLSKQSRRRPPSPSPSP